MECLDHGAHLPLLWVSLSKYRPSSWWSDILMKISAHQLQCFVLFRIHFFGFVPVSHGLAFL